MQPSHNSEDDVDDEKNEIILLSIHMYAHKYQSIQNISSHSYVKSFLSVSFIITHTLTYPQPTAVEIQASHTHNVINYDSKR